MGDEGTRIKVVWPEEGLWPQGGYANAFSINHTPWDFTIRMGQMVLPTMDVDNVARAVVYMASLPLDANVLFMTVMATKMPFVGRG